MPIPLSDFVELTDKLLDWLNKNQGILTFLIFIATLFFGWITGIFKALQQQPKLNVSLLEGPTFSCTFLTGTKYGEFDVHQTAIALYLKVSNSGTAPTSIDKIELGYHWNLRRFSWKWLKYSIGWFWLTDQTVALNDFQVTIGKSLKVYPFLFQRNNSSPTNQNTYLRIGESTNGVVYFEQNESWGGCFPTSSRGAIKIKLRLYDTHGRKYVSKHKIPNINLDKAKKYNPYFGITLSELHNEAISTE